MRWKTYGIISFILIAIGIFLGRIRILNSITKVADIFRTFGIDSIGAVHLSLVFLSWIFIITGIIIAVIQLKKSKDQPYWIRAGFIGLIAGAILTIFFDIIENLFAIFYIILGGITDCEGLLFNGREVLGCASSDFSIILADLGSLILYVIIGIIIGLIYGKIKSKSPDNATMP